MVIEIFIHQLGYVELWKLKSLVDTDHWCKLRLYKNQSLNAMILFSTWGSTGFLRRVLGIKPTSQIQIHEHTYFDWQHGNCWIPWTNTYKYGETGRTLSLGKNTNPLARRWKQNLPGDVYTVSGFIIPSSGLSELMNTCARMHMQAYTKGHKTNKLIKISNFLSVDNLNLHRI